jgi:hypothetical protein
MHPLLWPPTPLFDTGEDKGGGAGSVMAVRIADHGSTATPSLTLSHVKQWGRGEECTTEEHMLDW